MASDYTMIETQVSNERITAYFQADAGERNRLFRGFVSELKALVQAGDHQTAHRWAGQAVSPVQDYSSVQRLGRIVRQAAAALPGEPFRLAVLGGPTTIQFVELLEAFLATVGPVEIFECEYGLFRQEILVPGSGLDRFEPQAVFLATSMRDIARLPRPGQAAADVAADLDAEATEWLGLWSAVRDRWGATVIQNLFEEPPWGSLGHYATRVPSAPEHFIRRLNARLLETAPPEVLFHDLPAVAANVGAADWFDPRYYLEAKMPCGPEALVRYAHSVGAVVRALRGKSRRVLVLDLDNTVWGGVIGDVGIQGLVLGQGSAEGEAFIAFQQWAKDLKDRGIVLAVCSKNDDATAREPFDRREDMVLRLDDIACFVANWQNKADNLRTIAAQLELGLDAFVFVDDNPAERAIVRRFLPEVAVPDLPADPAGYVAAVAQHRYFEAASWTREDAERAAYYAQNARRNELRLQAGDLQGFLASLNMEARLAPVSEVNLQRVTQLVNKSNQFNLTTRRRTQTEIAALAEARDWATLTVSLRDTLGDNGLISVIFVKREDGIASIDTWLMSCRVLQRGVEAFVLNELARQAQDAGCHELVGTYIPTARNALVRDHFANLGFLPAGADGDTTFWRLPIDGYTPHDTFIQAVAVHD